MKPQYRIISIYTLILSLSWGVLVPFNFFGNQVFFFNLLSQLSYGLIFGLIVSIFLLSLVSAQVQSLPQQEQGECIELPQVCADCTYVNMSSVKLPNSTTLIINEGMTQNGPDFSYTFCNTTLTGDYIATTCGDPDETYTCVSYDFEITPNGDRLDIQDALFYLGLLTIFLIFFFVSVSKLREVSNFGWAIFYLCFMYLDLMVVFFVSWQMADGFLTSIPIIASFFYIFWLIFLWGLLPFLLFLFLYMMSKIFNQKELESLM